MIRSDDRWFGVAPAVAMALVLAGCTEPNPAYQQGPELPEECRAGSEVSETFENFERPGKVDLWFVVADSDPMEPYQDAMADAMPSLLSGLAEEGFDVRVGVSTTDGTVEPGLAPIIGGPDDCADNVDAVARSGEDGWIDSVRCNIRQGTDGDRRQRALDVTYEALVESPASLRDLRRDDARLVTVMVGREDDCSGDDFDDDADTPVRDLCHWQADDLRDVDAWVDAIRETATVPEGISVASIAGPPADVTYEEGESVRRVCSSTLGDGYPSPRMYNAAAGFGDQGLFTGICVFDFHDVFDDLSTRLIEQEQVTLCAAEPMAHEPLAVVRVDDEGNEENVSFGDGFVFAGATEECEEGAIRLTRQGAESLARLEMTYCTL